MYKEIDKLISEGKVRETITKCSSENKHSLAKLLCFITNKKRVLLTCNWTDSKTLCELWNKMSKGNYTWNNIEIVHEEPADFYCVINSPPTGYVIPDLTKTVYFQMEPHMSCNQQMWGHWALPNDYIKNSLLFCGIHTEHYNNNEWHLSRTYNQLSTEKIVKLESCNVISTVLSTKYRDPGHIKRIDFVKFLEQNGVIVDVYGGDSGWKNYKGTLKAHEKDNALFPYKYTFNAENHEINNYYTEKIVDAILAECLIFYWGCPNICSLIDERAFVKLELVDFEKDLQIIQEAIRDNWWEQRLPYIQEAKRKILNETSFFPRLSKIIN